MEQIDCPELGYCGLERSEAAGRGQRVARCHTAAVRGRELALPVTAVPQGCALHSSWCFPPQPACSAALALGSAVSLGASMSFVLTAVALDSKSFMQGTA